MLVSHGFFFHIKNIFTLLCKNPACMNVLIVEDEKIVAKAIVRLLKKIPNINIVDVANDFAEGLEMANSDIFDIILIDVMLSDNRKREGLELCRLIRKKQKDIPIVIITGYHCAEVLEAAFSSGANDYIKKPFDSRELQLRIQNWLMMSRKIQIQEKLRYRQLVYSSKKHEFYFNNNHLLLPKKIKALLLIFLRRPGELLTQDYIQVKLWGDRDFAVNRNVRSNIQRLRRYLPRSFSVGISTVRGEGYVLQ